MRIGKLLYDLIVAKTEKELYEIIGSTVAIILIQIILYTITLLLITLLLVVIPDPDKDDRTNRRNRKERSGTKDDPGTRSIMDRGYSQVTKGLKKIRETSITTAKGMIPSGLVQWWNRLTRTTIQHGVLRNRSSPRSFSRRHCRWLPKERSYLLMMLAVQSAVADQEVHTI